MLNVLMIWTSVSMGCFRNLATAKKSTSDTYLLELFISILLGIK